jgi:erythromycin esterase-like protein
VAFFTSKRRAIDDFKSYAEQRAVRFGSLDACDANLGRLLALNSLLAGKRIAFVGEPDHFIHEKYAYRTLMLRWLSARGFAHIGEELGVSDSGSIAKFIASGDVFHLERVATYGYKGADRTDRDDTPLGIMRESFTRTYPTAQLAAEQKRFAHSLREIGMERLSRGEEALHFFGIDIDPPGGGYEDALAVLHEAQAAPDVAPILAGLRRVAGESIDDEIARLDRVLAAINSSMRQLGDSIGKKNTADLCDSITCLRESLAFRAGIRMATDYRALNPAMADRERFMQRNVERAIRAAGRDSKLVLMSHNLHLCRDIAAVRRSDAAAGPGGKTDPPLGTWLATRYPGEIFACWMLIGQGRDCQPYPDLSSDIKLKAGTLNAILNEISECFMLPVDTSDPRARLLSSEVEVQWDGIGGVRTPIVPQADALFFIRNVTPLRA